MYGTNITQHSTFPDFTNHTLITQLFQLPTILVSNTHKHTHTQAHTNTHIHSPGSTLPPVVATTLLLGW